MNPAIQRMLERYPRRTLDENVNALREILQELALLGLWRSKFFEHAAFYGGSALRILYGLERFSEDLDFSLLAPRKDFVLGEYGSALERELRSFGFEASFEPVRKRLRSPIESVFLKTNTLKTMVFIKAEPDLIRGLQSGQRLAIRLEVDVDPPSGFETEAKPVLQPIPFAVRTYCLPDLFAGKMHAILCRRWRNRVKGRDWYDFVWYVANYPRLHLNHLERRMRQSGDYAGEAPLSPAALRQAFVDVVENLDVEKARGEVLPFLFDSRSVEVWSRDFFLSLIGEVEIV